MLDWLAGELTERREQHLYRSAMIVHHGKPGYIQIDGRWLNNFGANDYLGLASHPAVIAASQQFASQSSMSRDDSSKLTLTSGSVCSGYRLGSGASPLVSGYTQDHAALELSLSRFEQVEAAILFSTGYAANVGTIAALASEGDLILSDELNHASLIDGCRLSRAKVVVYPHCNIDALAQRLKEHQGFARRVFIVTDSLFSMDGDIAPLCEIVAVANECNATVIVDEAHGTGVYGDRGSGVVEALGLIDEIPVRIGTLSKAIGCMGGFVVGSQTLIDYLRNRARTYIYSTAMPAVIARAAQASVAIMHSMREERMQLRDRSYRLRQSLKQLGLRTSDGDSPIVPVYVGSPDEAIELARQLREAGHFVPAIRPPTVPRDGSLLRISLSTAHSEERVDHLIQSIACLASKPS
jgi:8-amino-7-oxononanoate synthase